MDMKISGSGSIPAGEYDVIKISGSGRLAGQVKCSSLHVSGSAHGEALECWGDVRVSGSAHFDKEVMCGSLYVSGAVHCGANVTVAHEIKLSGGSRCEGNLKCGELYVAGALQAEQNIEAETVRIHGGIGCDGLLNAEDIEIEIEQNAKSSIGSIGCSKLFVERRNSHKLFRRRGNGVLTVKNEIEGDEIEIEYVVCPRVSGRCVTLGEGCEIELLQYSEKYEIHEKAKVGRIERI